MFNVKQTRVAKKHGIVLRLQMIFFWSVEKGFVISISISKNNPCISMEESVGGEPV